MLNSQAYTTFRYKHIISLGASNCSLKVEYYNDSNDYDVVKTVTSYGDNGQTYNLFNDFYTYIKTLSYYNLYGKSSNGIIIDITESTDNLSEFAIRVQCENKDGIEIININSDQYGIWGSIAETVFDTQTKTSVSQVQKGEYDGYVDPY